MGFFRGMADAYQQGELMAQIQRAIKALAPIREVVGGSMTVQRASATTEWMKVQKQLRPWSPPAEWTLDQLATELSQMLEQVSNDAGLRLNERGLYHREGPPAEPKRQDPNRGFLQSFTDGWKQGGLQGRFKEALKNLAALQQAVGDSQTVGSCAAHPLWLKVQKQLTPFSPSATKPLDVLATELSQMLEQVNKDATLRLNEDGLCRV